MQRLRTPGRLRALFLCSVLAAAASLLLSSCKGPRVKLPVHGDEDDDDDDIIACDADTPCMHSILKVCGRAGFCVECRTSADCEQGVCDSEGECESSDLD